MLATLPLPLREACELHLSDRNHLKEVLLAADPQRSLGHLFSKLNALEEACVGRHRTGEADLPVDADAKLRDSAAIKEQWPPALHVSQDLPSHSAHDVLQCRLRPARANLSDCTMMALAATGSSTLFSWLSKVGHSKHAIHNHAADTWEGLLLADKIQGKGKRKMPACVIISLRDPAERLESGMRFDLFGVPGHVGSLVSNAGQLLHGRITRRTDLDGLIAALRDCSNASSRVGNGNCSAAQQAAGNGMLGMYTSSAARPIWPHGLNLAGVPGPQGGSYYMVSQLAYLRGLHCRNETSPDVHFVCTERLSEGLDALSRRIGTGAGSLVNAARQNRSSSHDSEHARISPQSADFVRNSMFPWDTALHEAICKRPESKFV